MIKTIAPEDYDIKHIEVNVPGVDGLNTIVLRGVGKSDRLGISIDNVELYTQENTNNLQQV